MKKVFLIIVMLISANIMFAQTATLRVGDVDLTGVAVGGDVVIPLYVDEINDGTIFTMQYFVGFDHAILTWKGSFANPLTGIQNFHPDFPYGTPNGAWLFNDNGTELVTLWDDASMFHTMPATNQVFYEMIFTYNGGVAEGGSAALVWGTSGKDVGGKYVKGTTEMYDQNFSQYALTLVNGSVFMPGGPMGITWDGSESANWFDGNNWDGGVVPTIADDVIIPAGMPFDPTISTDDILLQVAEAASITNAATLTINPFGFLSVAGAFTNTGSVMMLSDADNSASYIGGAVGGTFQYARYMGTGGTGLEGGWHYMSSPIAAFGSYNMYDYYLNTWDEATGMWIQHAGDPQVPCTPAPEIFNNGMEGWSVNFDEAYLCEATLPGTGMTVEFNGAPNVGDQTGVATNSGVGMYAGFNLVGNPYPSYWNYDGYWSGPNWTGNLFDAIYYWDENMMQYASYVNGIGTNGGGPYVAPAQAFFLESSVASEGLTFTDAERAHVYGLPFYKDASDLVKLLATANGYTDETVIRFGEEYTTARDMSDARKLISTAASVPTLYTMAGDLTISVNGMPSTESVPVYFECGTSGTYTIEAVETSDFTYLVLEDLLLGSQTNLLEGSYTFEHVTGNIANRFVLHFAPLGVSELGANSVKIWARDNNIIVNVAAQVTGQIAVYNMMGQEIVRTEIESVQTQIPVSDVNTYYVVKVISDSNAVTGKVYVK